MSLAYETCHLHLNATSHVAYIHTCEPVMSQTCTQMQKSCRKRTYIRTSHVANIQTNQPVILVPQSAASPAVRERVHMRARAPRAQGRARARARARVIYILNSSFSATVSPPPLLPPLFMEADTVPAVCVCVHVYVCVCVHVCACV